MEGYIDEKDLKIHQDGGYMSPSLNKSNISIINPGQFCGEEDILKPAWDEKSGKYEISE